MLAKLYIGISPRGKLYGLQVSDRTQQEIANIINQIEPAPTISIKLEPVTDSKSIVVLEVIPSKQQVPYVYRGRPFIRIGTTTNLMKQNQYHELLDKKRFQALRWEQMPAHTQSIDDLDHDEILKTLQDGAHSISAFPLRLQPMRKVFWKN